MQTRGLYCHGAYNQPWYDHYQSAYHEGHSTESALLRTRRSRDVDIMALDAGDGVLMVLRDLGAASDTIHHQLLLDRLELGCQTTGKSTAG